MSDKPPRKRPGQTYGPGGLRLSHPVTKRRRDAELARGRAAEIVRHAELYDVQCERERLQKIAADARSALDRSAPMPSGSGIDLRTPREREMDQRSDFGTLLDGEDDHALRLSEVTDSCVASTMIDDDAAGASNHEHVDSSDEDVSGESSLPTTDGASSPTPAGFDCNNFTADKLREYICGGGDAVMFPESDLRTWQVVMVILGLCTRFSLSAKARRALIDAVKLFAGPRFANWDISDHYLSKIFDPPDEVVRYHFYCEVCCKELEKPVTRSRFKNHVTTCVRCSKGYTLNMDAPNYLVSIDLKYQISSLLNLKVVNEDLAKSLNNLHTNERDSGGNIRDVYDGSLYKKVLSETPPHSTLLTCVFNTDGAPLFNSSERAFWPILLVLNELSPRVRFRYPLLAGLCIVRKEPSPDMMNVYMKYFVKDLQRLGTEGFDLRIGKRMVHCVLKPLLCSVDSVARPLLQNRLQFNGYYGCSWCYARGEHFHGCMRFLMKDIEPMDRTHRDYVTDVRDANRKNRNQKGKKRCDVRGVKGDSVLTSLQEQFDMIWAFVRDYLHADLLGVILQLFNMWMDPQCPVRLSKAQVDEVNKRLMKMTPPREVHRLVRPLKTERCKWKASEWRSWLLFYAIPCLKGILDDYALQHLALYVNGIYTLLQTNITESDLQRANNDLQRFVILFEVLYGARYVTFNVHSVKHLVECVRRTGPLWATSTFPFENAIHQLKQYVHGAKGVCEQMTKKSIQSNVYRSLLEEEDQSPACSAFQESLFGRTVVASYDRCRGVVFLGSGFPYGDVHRDFRAVNEGEIKAFRRCISAGMVIHGAATDKSALKSDDTVFWTADGRFVQVLHLFKYRRTAFAKVVRFKVAEVILRSVDEASERSENPVIGDVAINHLFRIEADEGTEMVLVTHLREKCVVMKVDDETYVSRLPNTVEIQ